MELTLSIGCHRDFSIASYSSYNQTNVFSRSWNVHKYAIRMTVKNQMCTCKGEEAYASISPRKHYYWQNIWNSSQAQTVIYLFQLHQNTRSELCLMTSMGVSHHATYQYTGLLSRSWRLGLKTYQRLVSRKIVNVSVSVSAIYVSCPRPIFGQIVQATVCSENGL